MKINTTLSYNWPICKSLKSIQRNIFILHWNVKKKNGNRRTVAIDLSSKRMSRIPARTKKVKKINSVEQCLGARLEYANSPTCFVVGKLRPGSTRTLKILAREIKHNNKHNTAVSGEKHGWMISCSSWVFWVWGRDDSDFRTSKVVYAAGSYVLVFSEHQLIVFPWHSAPLGSG